MHRLGDQAPALDLLATVDARGPGVPLPLHRHLGRLLTINAAEARCA
jgi:hypothetical protein